MELFSLWFGFYQRGYFAYLPKDSAMEKAGKIDRYTCFSLVGG